MIAIILNSRNSEFKRTPILDVGNHFWDILVEESLEFSIVNFI